MGGKIAGSRCGEGEAKVGWINGVHGWLGFPVFPWQESAGRGVGYEIKG